MARHYLATKANQNILKDIVLKEKNIDLIWIPFKHTLAQDEGHHVASQMQGPCQEISDFRPVSFGWVPGSQWTLVLLPLLTRMWELCGEVGQVESGSHGWRSASAYFPSGVLHPPLTVLSFDHFICGNIISSYTMTYPAELLWEVTTEALPCPSVTGGIQSRNRSGALSYWLSWFIPYDWLFLAPLSYLGECQDPSDILKYRRSFSNTGVRDADFHPIKKKHIYLLTPQNLTTNGLPSAGSLTDNINTRLTYILCVIYSTYPVFLQ